MKGLAKSNLFEGMPIKFSNHLPQPTPGNQRSGFSRQLPGAADPHVGLGKLKKLTRLVVSNSLK
jgi:hypothetical protein